MSRKKTSEAKGTSAPEALTALKNELEQRQRELLELQAIVEAKRKELALRRQMLEAEMETLTATGKDLRVASELKASNRTRAQEVFKRAAKVLDSSSTRTTKTKKRQ